MHTRAFCIALALSVPAVAGCTLEDVKEGTPCPGVQTIYLLNGEPCTQESKTSVCKSVLSDLAKEYCPSGYQCSEQAKECNAKCDDGKVLCNHTCMEDPKTNPLFCGCNDTSKKTGQNCFTLGTGLICESGRCQCETKEEVLCGGTCINPNKDNAHCGCNDELKEAGQACSTDAGLSCQNGRCQCKENYVLCNGKCINPNENDEFCGCNDELKEAGENCLEKLSGFRCKNGSCQCEDGYVLKEGKCAEAECDPEKDMTSCGPFLQGNDSIPRSYQCVDRVRVWGEECTVPDSVGSPECKNSFVPICKDNACDYQCGDPSKTKCPGSKKASCSFVCADLETDNDHCGDCSNPCNESTIPTPHPANAIAKCQDGQCIVACKAGHSKILEYCLPECVDSMKSQKSYESDRFYRYNVRCVSDQDYESLKQSQKNACCYTDKYGYLFDDPKIPDQIEKPIFDPTGPPVPLEP